MAVPGFTLDRVRAEIEAEVQERWRSVLDRTAFVSGPEVAEFEAAFADFLGAAGVVGVGNGTDALTVSIRALGLKPGDEVVVPALSFYATAEAVVLAGGVPVFADVEPGTLNLDVESARSKITPKTVGLIGVHLYGRPFDVVGALELCREYDLWLVEDAAQAHGAAVDGQKVGTFGNLAAWSFYPSKNLGCFGDGGAITAPETSLVDETSSVDGALSLDEARLLANHGLVGRYAFDRIGTNSRLDGLQAAVLNVRLPRLAAANDRRIEIAERYREALGGLEDLRFLEDRPGDRCVYHQLTVLTSRRDELMTFLGDRSIGSSVHYPEALSRVAPIRRHLESLGADAGAHPVAERAAQRILCLPIFPEMTDAEVDEVVAAVLAFFDS